ncbi:MAG: hypothetical protein M3165_05910, partial [Actinomycetota bacterium]|nr:hypothetical protein [Actinomycetota bacterium]
LWAAARFLAGQRTGAVGLAALSLVGAGLLGIVVGAQVAATTGADPTEAGRAAIGCCVLGVGFLLTALGLLAGTVGLLLGARGPYLGYAGWNAG